MRRAGNGEEGVGKGGGKAAEEREAQKRREWRRSSLCVCLETEIRIQREESRLGGRSETAIGRDLTKKKKKNLFRIHSC